MVDRALRFDLVGHDRSLGRTLDQAGQKTARLGGAIGRVASVAGGALVAGVGAAAVGAFKLGESFDSAYDTIRVGTGKTGKGLEELKTVFRDVVRDVPTDFESASVAITELAKRTGETGKPLRALSDRMLEMTRLTGGDLKENIASVTRLFGDWSIKSKDQAGAMDKLFRASQATGVGINDLAQTVVEFGAPLRQLGFTFDQSIALLAKWEKEGVNTSTVLAGLKQGLGRFAAAGKEPAKALADVEKKIKDAGSAASANKIAIEAFGKRAGPDLAAAVRESRFDLGDLYNTVTNGKDTILSASKDTQDFAETWQKFKNTMAVLVEPAVAAVFGAVGTLADQISTKAIPAMQSFWKDHGPKLSLSLGDLYGKVQQLLDPTAQFGSGLTAASLSSDDLASKITTTTENIGKGIDVFRRAGDILNFVASYSDFLATALHLRLRFAFLETAEIAGQVSKGVLNIGVAAGLTGNIIDRFSGGSGHAFDAFVKSARNMRDQADSQLGDIRKDIRTTKAEIAGLKAPKLVFRGEDKVSPVISQIMKEMKDRGFSVTARLIRGGTAAKGMLVKGPGTTTSDTAGLFALSRDEAVVPARSAGKPEFRAWAASEGIPGFKRGGIVGGRPWPATVNLASSRESLLSRFGSGSIKAFIRAADALPYVWGGVGPFGFDCSGLTGAVYAMMRGLAPFRRYFTTASNFGALGFKPGPGGVYTIGVDAGRGHMVGRYAGLPFEAESTRTGIKVGSAASSVSSFPAQYHMAKGGLVGNLADWLGRQRGIAVGGDPAKLRIERFDRGGLLPPGLSMAYNGTGRGEPVGIDYDRLGAAVAKALVGMKVDLDREQVGRVIVDPTARRIRQQLSGGAARA